MSHKACFMMKSLMHLRLCGLILAAWHDSFKHDLIDIYLSTLLKTQTSQKFLYSLGVLAGFIKIYATSGI
jgi:hypothetical protein